MCVCVCSSVAPKLCAFSCDTPEVAWNEEIEESNDGLVGGQDIFGDFLNTSVYCGCCAELCAEFERLVYSCEILLCCRTV